MIDLRHVAPDATPPAGARARVLARVPRRVEAIRRRRTIAGCALVLGTAIAVVAVAGRLHARSEAPPEPTQVIAVGASLAAGVLELPSRARVLVEDRAAVWLVRDDDRGSILRVDRGAIVVHVAPRPRDRPFAIVARDVRVEVVGTTFAVAVAADGTVGVRGYEGTVRVIHRGTEARVGAGEVWPSQDRAPAIDEAARAKVAFEHTGEASPPVPPLPAPQLSPPQLSPPQLSPPQLSPAQLSPPQPSPPPRLPPSQAMAPRPPTGPTPEVTPSPYVAARALEDSGQLGPALAAYRAIQVGPEAEDALYAAGRLMAAQLGEPEAAHLVFQAYRRRYRDGRYARAVDARFLDAAIAARDLAGIEREATAFLDAYPRDPLAARFRLARASARVHRGDCASAIADLDQLPPSHASDRLRASCP